MKKDILKKAFVFGIFLAFLTASILPNVVSDEGLLEENLNLDYSDDAQTDPNDDRNYEILWAGKATVMYNRPGKVEIELECEPDLEKNITVPGPNLYLIFLLETNMKLLFQPPISRLAQYNLYAYIDDDIRYDMTRMKMVEPGKKSNILGMGYLLQSVHNRTVIIKIVVEVKSLIPPSSREECICNVILHISPPSSEATDGEEGPW